MDRYDRNGDGVITLAGHDDAEQPSLQSEKVVTNNSVVYSGTFIVDDFEYDNPML